MTVRSAVHNNVILLYAWLLLFVVAVVTVTKPAQGLLFSDDFIVFARLRCFRAYYRLGFDFTDFASYHIAFRDDSVLEIAQTGMYQGADNIEEYVKFGSPDFSPYFMSGNNEIERKIKFLGYENGQCKALYVYNSKYQPFLNITAAGTPASFEVVTGVKLYFDLKERYIKRVHFYYTDDFFRVVFGVFLNSANTSKYICGVMNGPCADIIDVPSDCEEQLLALPGTEGQQSFIDGKSQGCRSLHAVFASTNPDNHCAHLSFTPVEDPHGNIKCQTSKGTLASSLFTESELQTFKDFSESVGIDPEIGHDFVE